MVFVVPIPYGLSTDSLFYFHNNESTEIIIMKNNGTPQAPINIFSIDACTVINE